MPLWARLVVQEWMGQVHPCILSLCPSGPAHLVVAQEWMDQVQGMVNQMLNSKKLLGSVDHKIEEMLQNQVCVGGGGDRVGVWDYGWGENWSMACTTWTTRSILQDQVG